jgi:hypothetical protein
MQVMHLPYHLFLIFTIAVVFSVFVQAIVFVGLLLIVGRATKKLLALANMLSDKAGPIVEQVGSIVRDAEPKIKTVSGQIVEITTAVRDQTLHVNATVETVVDKTNVQVGKVDEMVSAVLGGIAHAGAVVQSGVLRPMRKAGGVLQGLRVGVETFFGNEGREQQSPQAVSQREGGIAEPISAEDHVPPQEAVPVAADPRRVEKYVVQPVSDRKATDVDDTLPPLNP